MPKMMCISLWQPWASLIAANAKRYETRSWAPRYRGPLLIHAAKKNDAEIKPFLRDPQMRRALTAGGIDPDTLPFGAVVAVADLTAVYRSEDARRDQSAQELDFGDWSDGRAVWRLDNVRRLASPIPMKGQQGLFEVEIDL